MRTYDIAVIVILFMSLTLFGCTKETHSEQWDDALLQRITEEAKRLEVKPIDAKVDAIWKAIPGYNGLTVDIERTYAYAKKLKGDRIPFVFKQVAPNVSLDDLGPWPIYRGNPHKPMVSLMINVAWGNEYIEPILQTLERENVLATFFLDGSWLKKNAALAQYIQSKGHEMSNHAYSHKNMGDLSEEAAKIEILKTEQLLQEHLQVNNVWFAPPAGHFDDETVQIAAELGLKTVLWTLDTVDWKNPDPSWIVRKITMNVEPGSLILMHPTRSSSEALPTLIKEIKARDLLIGTVSETLSEERIHPVEGQLKLW